MPGGNFWDSRNIEVKQTDAVTLSADVNAVYGATAAVLTRPAWARFLAFQILADGFWVKPGKHPGLTFVDGDVTVGTDVIAIAAHGFTSGDGPYQLTTTIALPAGLALLTDYYVRAVTAGTITLHTSQSDAKKGTDPVDITAAVGGGTHTIGAMTAANPTATNTNGQEAVHITLAATNGGVVVVAAPSTVTVKGDAGTASMPYWWLP